MTTLNVLTYNVCWECMTGETKQGSAVNYGIKCSKTKKKDGNNICFRNVSKVASNTKFDLIGLQEANIKLARNIIKNLGSRYKMVYSKSCNEHSIIIYNSNKLKKVGKRIFGDLDECGRPFLYQTFIDKKTNNLLVVGNFHGPHLNYDWEVKYINKIYDLIYKNCMISKYVKYYKCKSNVKVIIFGDFNKELKKSFKIRKTKKVLIPINRKIKTSLNPNNLDKIKESYYEKCIDNILISKNIKLINKCETLNSKFNNLLPNDFNLKYLNYTSDHRPIAAKLLI